MRRQIAIVEDEVTLRDNYADALRKYGCQVTVYPNRRQAQRAFERALPDLAVIDIMLEDEAEGGFELCQWLRAKSSTVPIIFLTARDSDLDTVSGLRLGADDYLSKDVSLEHLLARVIALFRRLDAMRESSSDDKPLERGALMISPERMSVTWNNEPLDLTVTEFWLLHSLAKRPGHVKTREQLMQDANVVVDEPTITSHIKRMRRKFESIDSDFDAIETIYGMGYRWK